MKPYWPAEMTTASDSEDLGPDRLRVETKVNVELHTENKLNHTGDGDSTLPRDAAVKDTPSAQANSNHQPEQRKGQASTNTENNVFAFFSLY